MEVTKFDGPTLTTASQQGTFVQFAGIALDIVSAWSWPLYRGADANAVRIRQGAGRAEEFQALNLGPHQLEVTTKGSAGKQDDYDTIVIENVYFDFAVSTDERDYEIRLYDRRYELRRDVFPIDINVRMSDGSRKSGTRYDTLKEALQAAMLALGYVEGTDFAFDDIPALDEKLPETLLLAGTVKANEGLSALLAGSGVDVTVGTDGLFHFVSNAKDDQLADAIPDYGWVELPTPDSDVAVVNGAPATVNVPFVQRQEYVATYYPPSSTVSFQIGVPRLYQVYRHAGGIYDIDTMISNIEAQMAGQFVNASPLRQNGISTNRFLEGAATGDWDNTILQPEPFRSGNSLQPTKEDADAARWCAGVVAQIQKDHLSLFQLTLTGDMSYVRGDLANIEFGVLDDTGKVVQANDDVSVVQSEWYEVIPKSAADFSLMASTGRLELSTAHAFGTTPFGAQWEGDGVIRVSPTAAQGVVRKLGELGSARYWRQMTGSEMAAVAANSPSGNSPSYKLVTETVRQPSKVEVRFVATKRSPAGLGRYHMQAVSTGISGASGEITLPAEGSIVAVKSDRVFTNAIAIEEAAARRAQPVIDSYNSSLAGSGIANGVGYVVDYPYPRAQIAEMSIDIGAAGAFSVQTSVYFAGGGVTEKQALARRKLQREAQQLNQEAF